MALGTNLGYVLRYLFPVRNVVIAAILTKSRSLSKALVLYVSPLDTSLIHARLAADSKEGEESPFVPLRSHR